MGETKWAWRECVIDIHLQHTTPKTTRFVLFQVQRPTELYMEKGQYQLYPTRQVAEEKMTELNAISS